MRPVGFVADALDDGFIIVLKFDDLMFQEGDARKQLVMVERRQGEHRVAE